MPTMRSVRIKRFKISIKCDSYRLSDLPHFQRDLLVLIYANLTHFQRDWLVFKFAHLKHFQRDLIGFIYSKYQYETTEEMSFKVK